MSFLTASKKRIVIGQQAIVQAGKHLAELVGSKWKYLRVDEFCERSLQHLEVEGCRSIKWWP